MAEDKRLLKSLPVVVSTALRLMVGLLLVSFALSLLNNDVPFWSGIGHCVTADWTAGSSGSTDALFQARDGAHVNAIPQYCAEQSNNYQRLLGVLSRTPSLILLAGGLILLNRLLHSATRVGIYTARTASKLQVLGWWLLLGSIAAALTQAIAQAALLSTLAESIPLSAESVLNTAKLPGLAVVTALGLLAFARIMRVGVAMREDIEGTV
ncbi:hypothetical protein [Streptomyces sp. KMM 9044]|uniref:hypothetical protein n=1 Tax=Streptomyces sp. KMM 9044 TaxID=2744474 RepID=UPI0021509829|nr:hypothetical protein [Streptomyces sp. KMM 9044]WAX78666.1 hypothetical protein HUV60_014220 [Streptomyces sp. KMM 9044]